MKKNDVDKIFSDELFFDKKKIALMRLLKRGKKVIDRMGILDKEANGKIWWK